VNLLDVAVHAFVEGRVQGVGFRFFVQRQALALGIKGWVRNLHGGATVEVMAEGPRADLEMLLADLRRGPRMASVEGVDASWQEAAGAFQGFEIRG
jgi:acylphosphatase